MKQFPDLEHFLRSKEFRKKDLSYCDLSNLNLSIFGEDTWNNFQFHHTNFKGTNIRFNPSKLKKHDGDELRNRYGIKQVFFRLEYCDFTDCDLSDLTSDVFLNVSVKGSNFTDTHLNIEWSNGYGGDIKYNWEGLGFKDYSDVVFPANSKVSQEVLNLCNVEAILHNPTIDFCSEIIFLILEKQLPEKDDYLSNRKIAELNELLDLVLKEDGNREGNLVRFYQILSSSSSFTPLERIRFFQGIVENKQFSIVDLSTIPKTVIELVEFSKCQFEKIIFPPSIERGESQIEFSDCETPFVYFPTMKIDSWKEPDFPSKTRIGKSHITIYRNLYLELGRACNGKCKFCRNQFLEPRHYRLKNIQKNLEQIEPSLDNIVIGGGEPTLLLKDIQKLMSTMGRGINWTIFTNGSCDIEKLLSLEGFYDLNISRHSISDDINNSILGVKSYTLEELRQLREHFSGNITLCPTCFKGKGLDTVEKLEDYIAFSTEAGISHILFQTLHKDLSRPEQMPVLPIEEEIFDELIIKLKEQGWKISIPIYSTGDYKLIIASKNGKSISFKKYITKEELEREWFQASKRTFDLSMDPSGNVYQNWHQSSDKVLLKKRS